MMIGIPPTVAAASDANQIVAASTSGTFAHWRLGNVDFKMGLLLVAGGVIGGTLGVQLIKILRAAGNADFVIKITYVIMLGVIGSYMFQESLKNLRPRPLQVAAPKLEKKSWFANCCEALPFAVRFEKSGITLSVFMPLILGTLVGVLSALMGVGGGFIMVPVMVYMLRMPMHVVVGTSLFQVLFTCIDVTFMQRGSSAGRLSSGRFHHRRTDRRPDQFPHESRSAQNSPGFHCTHCYDQDGSRPASYTRLDAFLWRRTLMNGQPREIILWSRN